MKKLSANELRKRAFRKFLYDNDVLEEWYKNTRELNTFNLCRTVLASVDDDIIHSAFVWSKSPEGCDFWSKLSREWKEMSESRVV